MRSPSFSDNRKVSWTPWTSSRRVIPIGLIQILLISATFIQRMSSPYDGGVNLDRNSLHYVSSMVTFAGNISVLICLIQTAILYRGKIEQLLNNLSSLYFNVFKHTNYPETQKFGYIIAYAVLTLVVEFPGFLLTTSWKLSFFLDLFWALPSKFTIAYVEIVLAIVLINLQTSVAGLNRKVKEQFPGVNECDWKCWKSAPGWKDQRVDDSFQLNGRLCLEEFRLAYRTVAKIVDQVNLVYGFSCLLIVTLYQMTCLFAVFGSMTLLFVDKVDEPSFSYRLAINLELEWIRCLVRMAVLFHSFEIVVRELEVTRFYVASIDASKIDPESKVELLEFLDEINSSRICFTASNVFFMDYPNFYSILNATVLYMIIVIQYLSVWS